MAKSEIQAGICGFTTAVHAQMDGEECVLHIQSNCPSVQRLAEQLQRVDPLQEISWRRSPRIMEAARQCCRHAACPVPSGILKAVEVAAGLALPADVAIRVSRDDAGS